MKYDNKTKKIYLEEKEACIIETAIVELGGPLHSPFAKHLQTYHYDDYDQIKRELDAEQGLSLERLHPVLDILQVFFVEPLENDWGTTYDDISKREVEDLLGKLIEFYSEQVKKY
jgi:hypothetical protein